MVNKQKGKDRNGKEKQRFWGSSVRMFSGGDQNTPGLLQEAE